MQGAGHRVAITGYGVVAPCGVGKAAFWQGLLGPGITNAKTVELADWDPQPYFSNPKEARQRQAQTRASKAGHKKEGAHKGGLSSSRDYSLFVMSLFFNPTNECCSKTTFSPPKTRYLGPRKPALLEAAGPAGRQSL